MLRFYALLLLGVAIVPADAMAAPSYACGDGVVGGGAQILCSHINAEAPAQSCDYSWSLKATDGTSTVVQGAFLLAPGNSNVVVYQGSGFDSELANPIITCQGTVPGRVPP